MVDCRTLRQGGKESPHTPNKTTPRERRDDCNGHFPTVEADDDHVCGILMDGEPR